MDDSFSIRHQFAGALWRVAIKTPAATFLALASDKRREFLQSIRMAAFPPGIADDGELDIETIEVQFRRVVNRPAVMLRIPPPYRCPDPQMIALVVDKQIRGDVRASYLNGGRVEFFTLEEPPDLPDRPLTYLCSTDVNGVHHNHGAGPVASFEEFGKALTRLYRPTPWWQFWRGWGSNKVPKPHCPECKAKLTVGSPTECKKCQWLRYPSDRARWEHAGDCPACGFSYRFDGVACSHCGHPGRLSTGSAM